MGTTGGRPLAALAAAVALAGCGSTGASHSEANGGASQATASPAVNEVALTGGSDQQQITSTIQAFYKATWLGQGAAACALFSPAGLSGFLEAAKVAFPGSVNSTTTCPQAMAFFHADLADSAQTLQQAGVNVPGSILERVGVSQIRLAGTSATAQAPDGVAEFIQPKTFVLVRVDGRWLIEASRKIGKTLPQLLAQAKHGTHPAQ